MKNNQLDEELKERIYLVTCNYIGSTKSDEFKQAVATLTRLRVANFTLGFAKNFAFHLYYDHLTALNNEMKKDIIDELVNFSDMVLQKINIFDKERE